MKKRIIGYTSGVYDLFHIGHLNLKKTKGMFDKLVADATVEELVTYKGKHVMNLFEDCIEIVRYNCYINIKYEKK